jgi:hypothetical protein
MTPGVNPYNKGFTPVLLYLSKDQASSEAQRTIISISQVE